MKLLTTFSIASASLGLGLIGASMALGVSPADALNVASEGHLSSAPAAHSARFDEQSALAHAEELAQSKLDETIGSSHKEQHLSPVQVSIADIPLVQHGLSAAGLRVSTVGGGSLEADGDSGIWTFVWEDRHFPIPEWRVTDGVLRVVIAFDAADGHLRVAQIDRENPNAIPK